MDVRRGQDITPVPNDWCDIQMTLEEAKELKAELLKLKRNSTRKTFPLVFGILDNLP